MLSPELTASAVVLGHVVCGIVLSWVYFRRLAISRPPIGVMNLADVGCMMVAIILVPIVYLSVSRGVVTAFLATGEISLFYFMFEPALHSKVTVWLVTLALVAADVGAAWVWGTDSRGFLAVNNAVLAISVVGAVNLWAQGGMKARDTALLGGLLVAYDVTATSVLTHMADLFAALQGLPFAPLTAWPTGGEEGYVLGIGLGDQLMAAVFPLVMRKAYGPTAGGWAMALGLAAIGTIFALPHLGVNIPLFPVMVVLGPLMIGQYLFWRRRCGVERTYRAYLAAESS